MDSLEDDIQKACAIALGVDHNAAAVRKILLSIFNPIRWKFDACDLRELNHDSSTLVLRLLQRDNLRTFQTRAGIEGLIPNGRKVFENLCTEHGVHYIDQIEDSLIDSVQSQDKIGLQKLEYLADRLRIEVEVELIRRDRLTESED